MWQFYKLDVRGKSVTVKVAVSHAVRHKLMTPKQQKGCWQQQGSQQQQEHQLQEKAQTQKQKRQQQQVLCGKAIKVTGNK